MPPTFDAYSRYYDLLYRDKDYAAEAAALDRLVQRFAPGCTKLLELGCGSGKHAHHLAALGYHVTGVERSSGMLANALPHPQVHYVEADLRTMVLGESFPTACSLFHVVSYLTNNADVEAAFSRVAAHLHPQGLFVFDVWFTPAVLRQRPAVRVKRMQDSHTAITRIAEPVLHPDANRVDVHYTVFVENLADGHITQLQETHPMRHFSLPELDLFAAKAGFRRVFAGNLLNGTAPSEDTWDVCCVFQKAE